MKLTLLLLVVTGCLAKPHLSQRERNFWAELNRLQYENYIPDESKQDFYDDDLLASWRRQYEVFEPGREREPLRELVPREQNPATTAPETTAPATTEAKTTEAKTTEAKTTEAKTTAPTTTETKTTEAKTTASETTAAKTTEAKTTEAKTTETKTTEAKTTAPATTETKTTEAKTTAPATTETKTTEAKTTASETTEAKTTEAKTTEAKTTEAKTTVPATTTSETTEAKTTEAKTTEAKTTETKTTAPATTEAKTTAPATAAPATEELEVAPEEVVESLWESSKEAIWVFTDDWFAVVIGKLVAGSSVLIVYDGGRLPWRDTKYGQKAWSIFAQYKFDEGKVHQQLLEGPIMIKGHEILTTKIFLPFGTSKLTIRFMYSGEISGTHWDSNLGNNYEQVVVEVKEATLVFQADYTEDKYGRPLEQGVKFQVYYSTERLEVGDGFTLYAAAQFKASGVIITHELTDPQNGYYVTAFDVSENAEEVIMWFYTKKGDEHHYDSNFGANYHFPLGA